VDENAEEFGPGLREVARRQDAAWLDAQEELEGYVETGRDRDRDLGDVALEAMHRGDMVSATVGERVFTGTVSHVGADVMTVVSRYGVETDIRLDALSQYRVVESVSQGGRPLEKTDPAEFRHCFFDPETEGYDVEVGGPQLGPTTGSIVLVGRDHLVMRAKGRGDWVVALAAVGYLIRR
jgi:hypothetical protein